MTTQNVDHIAVLVPSCSHALEYLRPLGFTVGNVQKFDAEGTFEVYVGSPSEGGLLLLIEPMESGPYAIAMKKRGPGIHHICIGVIDLDIFVEGLCGSGDPKI